MMNNKEVNLRTFPSNLADATAIAWLQQQGLSDKTPEEAIEMYCDAYRRIDTRYKEINRETHKGFL